MSPQTRLSSPNWRERLALIVNYITSMFLYFADLVAGLFPQR
jgi:hypothetical protein